MYDEIEISYKKRYNKRNKVIIRIKIILNVQYQWKFNQYYVN